MSHYSNGYAVAILVNGNVVETRQDSVVSVPFGSDYVIRLINRNGKRAVARVEIDGQNVTSNGVIVDSYGAVDLQRPLDKPVTFRFASVESKAAAEHGKAGQDVDGSKGLITVQWQPEKEIERYGTGYYGALAKKLDDYKPVPYTHSTLHRSSNVRVDGQSMNEPTRGGIVLSATAPTSTLSKSGVVRSPELQSGVTVEGQYSNQTFRTATFTIDYSVQPTVVSVKLMGYVESEGVPRQGTRYCPSCRTTTKKKTDKFCRNCGEQL